MAFVLTVDGLEVSGEIALAIPPGTNAKQIEKMLTEALSDELDRAAGELASVLSTYPSRYARQLPGRDDEGRTRYAVSARKEGGRLVPFHKPLRHLAPANIGRAALGNVCFAGCESALPVM